jgi:hypothetical protein
MLKATNDDVVVRPPRSPRLTSQSRPTVVELEHDLVLALRSDLK